ncbi:unnamed protein product [Parnassius apollo]|uniref:(apollo) hypothetical protein n=1 Tax=Parnassius apollo TaxID=110799 RepID=A0A8S3X323_PARAO|nr:unnamed protein product [Parnassius apollo]
MNTSQKCAGCKNSLQKEYLQCAACKSKYDMECANISHKSLNLMERKDKWKCPSCVCIQPKKGNVNTPVCSTATIIGRITEQETNICTKPHDLTYDDNNVTQRAKISRPSSSSEQSSPVGENSGYSNIPYSAMLDDLKLFIKELLHT